MIQALEAPKLVFFSLLGPLLAALVVLIWGRKLARRGDWLMGLSFALSAIGLSFAGAAMSEQGFKPQVWHQGWIWSRAEMGSITVGILADRVAFSLTAISLLVSLVLLSQRSLFSKEPRAERVYAALGFSFSGIALAWFSLTPWLAILGLTLTVFAGFSALGSRWDSLKDAQAASWFAWERMSGVFLICLGACGIVGTRASFGWNDAVLAVAPVGVPISDFLGGGLLALGLYVQCQPFPLLGWVALESNETVSVRAILSQVFTGVAAFALLFRLEPQFRAFGIFPGMGWAYLASAVLALCMGLFHSRWRVGFGSWISAGLSLASAALAFSGQQNGLQLLLGVFLGVVAVATAVSAIDSGSSAVGASMTRGRWVKVGGFLGVGVATGMLGFVSVGGLIHWVGQSWENPFQAAVVLLVIFLFSILGWRLAWKLARGPRAVEIGWVPTLAIFVPILLGVALLWTGAVTGSAFPGNFDQALPSLFDQFFEGAKSTLPDEGVMTIVSSVFWGLWIVGLGLAFWLAQKEPWNPRRPMVLKLRQFVITGYGVDPLSRFFFKGLMRAGVGLEHLVDQKIWSEWVPYGFSTTIRFLANVVSVVDYKIYRRFSAFLRRGVETPARAVQFLQNGDVQWYLLFAVGSGIAILIYFMKY